MTIAISKDGGRTWLCKRNLDVKDGYYMTNNFREMLNREYSYPSIKQPPDGKLHVAYTIIARRLNMSAWMKNG